MVNQNYIFIHEVFCFVHKYIAPVTGDGVRNIQSFQKNLQPRR